MGTPTLIVVTGPAGSGKTTLAHALGAAVGCLTLCRDEIKEGMVLNHPGFVPSTSDILTMRTFDVFFQAITLFLRAEVTMVAEAAFQHPLWLQSLQPLVGLAELKVIRCRAPAELARERVQARLRVQANRAAHADVDHLSQEREFDHLHIDAPTLDVDTTAGWRPGLDDITSFCRA